MSDPTFAGFFQAFDVNSSRRVHVAMASFNLGHSKLQLIFCLHSPYCFNLRVSQYNVPAQKLHVHAEIQSFLVDIHVGY